MQANGLEMSQQRVHSASKTVSLNPKFVSHARKNSWCDPFKSWEKVQFTLFDLPLTFIYQYLSRPIRSTLLQI